MIQHTPRKFPYRLWITRLTRATRIIMTLMTVDMLRRAQTQEAFVQAAQFAICWILLIVLDPFVLQWAFPGKEKNETEAEDSARLERLSLADLYTDYQRRKEQARRLYEAELEEIETDYQHLMVEMDEQEQTS